MMYQNPMPQPPMQAMADQMAQQGRYGDSMMVHMNPIEVAGIASLSPTGQLTTNPMTGQPEAFLPALLAPLLGNVVGGAISSSLLGGLQAGLVKTALGAGIKGVAAEGIRSLATGEDFDPTKALTSSVTSVGIDQAVKSGAEAVQGLAGFEDAATQAQKLADVATKTGIEQGLTPDAIAQNPFVEAAGTAREGADLVAQEAAKMSALDVVKQGGAMDIAKGFLSPAAAAPIAIGEGQRAAIEAQDERDRMFGRRAADREEDLRRSRDILTTATGQVASDYGMNYGTQYAAQGGITSVDPADFQRRYNELQMMGREPMQMRRGGDIEDTNIRRALQPAQIVARQASLRGPVKTPSELPANYRPGFDPEISYFKSPFVTSDQTGVPTPGTPGTIPQIDPSLMQGIGSVGKAGGMGGARSVPPRVEEAMEIANRRTLSTRKRKAAQKIVDEYEAEQERDQDYFDDIMDATYGNQYAARMQEGGETEMNQQAAMRLIEQVSMALLGRLSEEESEAVINRFIDEFGSEAFQMLRSQVLESVVPNSQKEGMIEGAGKGMDDQVQGMIGDSQPVAVSPGEFIVPADVVSGIGDGDTNSGVKELEGMMDRVRQERTGTTKQPAPLGAMAGGAIPA
jgi:hypothetical protein